jgi:peptidoglycan/LPS O-acetylase OafA/YrhL
MGVLRLLLALLVADAHLGAFTNMGWFTEHAIFAVRAFFVMSGFYMAMVVKERYQKKGLAAFYLARATRLLPLYWVTSAILMLIIAAMTTSGTRFSPHLDVVGVWQGLHLSRLPWWLLAYISASLSTLIGTDTGVWLGFSPVDGALSLAPEYAPDATTLLELTPIPQAWTLGLEAVFYLLAPFVVLRSWRFIAILAGVSLIVRIAIHHSALYTHPWDRSLFPLELIFFMIGVLSFKAYAAMPMARIPRAVEAIGVAVCAAAVISVRLVAVRQGQPGSLDILASVLLAAGLPFLFALTKRSDADRRLGDLSYPLYLVHFGAFAIMAKLFPEATLDGTWFVTNLAVVLVAAFLLDLAIGRPLDRWRAGIKQTSSAVPSDSLPAR